MKIQNVISYNLLGGAQKPAVAWKDWGADETPVRSVRPPIRQKSEAVGRPADVCCRCLESRRVASSLHDAKRQSSVSHRTEQLLSLAKDLIR
jgi:hypothetical protein